MFPHPFSPEGAFFFRHCYYFTCQLSPDDIPRTHLNKSRLIVCIFLTADRAEASERPFLQLSSSYANIFVWLSSTIFPGPKRFVLQLRLITASIKITPPHLHRIALLFHIRIYAPMNAIIIDDHPLARIAIRNLSTATVLPSRQSSTAALMPCRPRKACSLTCSSSTSIFRSSAVSRCWSSCANAATGNNHHHFR